MQPSLLLSLALLSGSSDWTTPAERSQYQLTPRYAETMSYFSRLDAASERVCMFSFGISPQGRSLNAVVISREGICTPDQARASGKEVILVQSGIHAGEIEGKDALMALARDLSVGGKHQKLLKHAVILAIPIFNVDGHGRFSRYNRINQNGPEQMGWRATAQNLNLNRDFVKADAPEMRHWLRLWNAWQPDLLIDLHNTNGADYQYELTWAFETRGNIHPALAAWNREAFGERVLGAMRRKNWKVFDYVTTVDDTDIRAGLVMDHSGPRYSTGYAAIANRSGLLIETHMLKDFRTRVRVNEAVLLEVLREIARRPGSLRAAVRAAEATTTARSGAAGSELAVRFKLEDAKREIKFLGVQDARTASEISGAQWVQYQADKKITLSLPVRDQVSVSAKVSPPVAYLIPPQWTEVIERLHAHGIEFRQLEQAHTASATAYRFDRFEWARQPFEGRLMLTMLEMHAEPIELEVPAGSVLALTGQPRGDILMHLLEPEAPDALIRWGFFNTIFEQKEYAEPRVLEKLARDMLAADPSLRAQFNEKLKDPAFAGDRWARLYFFYQRSPWFDPEYLRYPVLRLDAAGVQQLLSVP
jgi:hypothetical protein